MLVANIVICIAMLWLRMTMRAPFLNAARNVKASQNKLLRRILRENAQTEFGKQHEFSGITSVESFRAQVPVSNYNDLSPYIKRQQKGASSLTIAAPVFYARTSGTTGRYKDIPMTASGVGQIKHFKRQLVYSLWRKTNFFKGTVLGFFSPGVEGQLSNGIPYGSTSGATYESLSPIFAQKFGIPKEAYSLIDVEAKYEVYALSALVYDSTTGVFTVNPSSLLKVCRIIEQRAEELLAALVKGDESGILKGTASVLPQLRKQMSPDRKVSLNLALNEEAVISPDILWPSLSTLVTWTGGSCGIALEKLKCYLPSCVQVVETGFACSEFIGTVNVDAERNVCLPMLTDNFYEFVERDDWEASDPKFLTLDELQLGRDYYIFATTSSGLYRYDINDVVRVTEGLGNCPGLKFVRKGKGVTNITGEKLSEDQVIAAVSSGLRHEGQVAATYLVLADENASVYRIMIELPAGISLSALSEKIETELRHSNGEYDDKRASGRLQPVVVKRFLDGADQAIKSRFLKGGVRESQYKPPVLGYWNDWVEWIDDWIDREET